MSDRAALLARAKAEANPQLLCEVVPIARLMGMQASLVGDAEDTVSLTMPFIERLGGNMAVPAIHGGALATLMETAALLTGIWQSGANARTITITVDYLRPAFLAETTATCVVLRKGRRVVSVQVTAAQGDRLVSAARVHMMLDAAG